MIIQLEALQCRYPTADFCFTGEVQAGEMLAISGPNGAGKSTLLNLLAGFIPAYQGKVYLAGHDHRDTLPSQRPISMLFQAGNLFPHLTVAQNIGLGLHPGLRLSASQKQQVNSMATQLQLQALLQQRPDQLSGGQQQRVALARCLLRQRPILLLDEPFAALDPQHRSELLALLQKQQREQGLTILIVTHQLAEIAPIAQRLWVIKEGKVAYDGLDLPLKKCRCE
ncbi:MAG: thiamine ABC transporter ATP-binding protein [Candidatus Symbiodolus clandestinus]